MIVIENCVRIGFGIELRDVCWRLFLDLVDIEMISFM